MTPGYHRISAERYHADPCVVPSLSSSIAKILLRESARKAWFSHPRLNPDHSEKEDDKFDLGSTAHAVLLEDDASNVVVIDPEAYPSKTGSIPAGWTNKAIRAARDAARSSGKVPLLKSVYADVQNMVQIANDFIAKSEIVEFWKGGESELTAICEEDGVWLRARLDRVTQTRRFIMDYKTTEDVSPETFSRQITRMGYHIQEAFYRRVARNLGAIGPRFVFIAQSCEAPYECSLHACDPSLQEIADAEVERAIHLWRVCSKSKFWPSYGGRIHYALPTSYQITDHEIRMAERRAAA